MECELKWTLKWLIGSVLPCTVIVVKFSLCSLTAIKFVICVGGSSKIVHKPAVEHNPQQRQPDITKAKTVLHWQPIVNYFLYYMCVIIKAEFLCVSLFFMCGHIFSVNFD